MLMIDLKYYSPLYCDTGVTWHPGGIWQDQCMNETSRCISLVGDSVKGSCIQETSREKKKPT